MQGAAMESKMTADNHPTAAPLTVEHINLIKWQIVQCNKLAHISEMQPSIKLWMDILSFVSLSLARPVPSDMAEDVKLVRTALSSLSSFEGIELTSMKLAHAAFSALDRIVAHLSQAQKSKPSIFADQKETEPYFDLRICGAIKDSELYNQGYRSEVFIGNQVCAYKETPQELAKRWTREGGWPGTREPVMETLQPRDAAPSRDAKSFANKFYASDDENDVESFCRCSFEKIIQQAIDQARAEGEASYKETLRRNKGGTL